ncbi:hemolysin family protein [Williamsia herbipolensis]|uniref:hemolysin family protein n=1 Tax=Williamsia herbipolensis TaxID=1603258 RepID=UPI0005F79D76|nr:CNNM domain-containing protein [Williamsia herbipolensis]
MVTILGILAGIVVVLIITAFTGYFVAQEFAYMAVDRSRLKAAAAAGDRAAQRALGVTRRTSFMLSGAQLGITVTGLLVGYVAEPLIGEGVGELLGGIGFGAAIGVAIGTVVAVVLSTLVQMLFGELFPKNLAIARPEPVAKWLARSTTLYLSMFGWLIWLFDQSSNVLLRVLGIKPVHDVEHSATPRDLAHIVAESRATGELAPDLSALLDRILDFPGRTAVHAMVPRSRVGTVSADEDVATVLQRMGTGHTRYPVIGDRPDDVRGVITLHDLLVDEPHGVAGDHLRPAVMVPTTLPLPAVLTTLDGADAEMAMVIDEYGGFAGIVTVEDIAEELVGDIADEHDADHPVQITGSPSDGWSLPGGMPIDEVERIIGYRLPAGDYETLAGAAIHAAGGFPECGSTVEIELPGDAADLVHDDVPPVRELAVTVVAVERMVPARVHARLVVRDDTDDADQTGSMETTR